MSLFALEPLKNRRILYRNGGLFKVVSNAYDWFWNNIVHGNCTRHTRISCTNIHEQL